MTAHEVTDTVKDLRGLHIPEERLRYYRGAPTVFGIATTDAMLLNPYPYECESHGCMTIIVHNTGAEEDIYHQYYEPHFNAPWASTVEIPISAPVIRPRVSV